MLIVGGGAALTVIAAHFVWLGVRTLRASWRARQQSRRHDAHENVHSSS